MVNFKSLALGAALALGALSFANAGSAIDEVFPPVKTTFENVDGRDVIRTIIPTAEDENICYAFEGTNAVCGKLIPGDRRLNKVIMTGTAPQDGKFVATDLFYDYTFNVLIRLKQETVTPWMMPYMPDDTAPRKPLEQAPMTRQAPQPVTYHVTAFVELGLLPDTVQARIKSR